MVHNELEAVEEEAVEQKAATGYQEAATSYQHLQEQHTSRQQTRDRKRERARENARGG